jgi:hypothetical protein
MTMRVSVVRTTSFAVLGLAIASVAWANHDTDCTISGGTNGPNQLDCRLPDFVAAQGSQFVLTSRFVYTPSTDREPATCAVGTLTVDPAGEFLSIDTTVLDATADNFQEVEVSVDPTGLAAGTYEGTVLIALTIGPNAPQCPSGPTGLSGMVFVRLIVTPPAPAPALAPAATAILALLLGVVGFVTLRRSRAMPLKPH